MPYYLIQTAVAPESWAKMIKSPQDRVELIRPAIEGLGYITFGEYRLCNDRGVPRVTYDPAK
jgi:hypothetical protein